MGTERVVRIDHGFGNRLRRAMADRKVTGLTLAEKAGVQRGTVTRWRKGECPDDLRYPVLAAALNVPDDWLKLGTGDDPKGLTVPARRAGSPPEASEAASGPSSGPKARADRWERLLRDVRFLERRAVDTGEAAPDELVVELLKAYRDDLNAD